MGRGDRFALWKDTSHMKHCWVIWRNFDVGPVAIYTCVWSLDSLSHTLKLQTAGITQGKALNQQSLQTLLTLTKKNRGGAQKNPSMKGVKAEKTLLSSSKHSSKQTAE